jgi:hypothetical protein
MGSYRAGRTLGIVASSSSLQRAWDSTTTAAASGAPGSYLAFELSTSDDGWSWQPVQFRQSGFAGIGSSIAGSAGPVGQEGVLGKVRGVYEPRLQGRLAAASSGSLEDNSWLLGLADKVMEVRGRRCRKHHISWLWFRTAVALHAVRLCAQYGAVVAHAMQ